MNMNSFLFYVAFLSLIFVVVCEAEDCDRNTGPAGFTHCFLGTPYYSKYQCGTCLTNAYIRQRSAGKEHCRDSTATYCYYQCMIEKYGLDRGPVYDDCLCEANSSLPQPSVILPAHCYSPDGTDCDWYRQCLARMFPCTGQAEYAISYGEKFCNLYEQSRSKFSPKGQRWIGAVRKCLQVALVPVLHICQVQPTCEEIRTKAFDSHVPCYIAPYQGFSVCDLQLTDWMKIFFTIKSSYVSSAWLETLEASVQTAANCAGYLGTKLGNYLFSLTVQIWDKLFGKRAADEILSDDELAHDIILHVSSFLQWNQDSTIDWYAFVVNTGANESSPTTPSTDQSHRDLIIQLFVVDRVDIGLLNVTETQGRRRLNETITQLADVTKQGLAGTVGNFRFHVASLRQCASGNDINDGCSNGTVVATGPPASTGPPISRNSASFTGKIGESSRIQYWLLAVAFYNAIMY